MSYVPENPLIAFVERNGYAPWEKPAEDPICPVCGSPCDTFYTNTFTHEIVGCDNCIVSDNAYTED